MDSYNLYVLLGEAIVDSDTYVRVNGDLARVLHAAIDDTGDVIIEIEERL